MKILIAEDLEELLEIVEMIIQGAYPDAIIYTALNGEIANKIINEQKNITLVISDYNMPKVNGGQVFTHLRIAHKETPYIMVSSDHIEEKSEFKNDAHVYQVHKPFTDKQLLDVVKKALDESHELDNHLKTPSPFIPIHTHLINKVGILSVPLYIRLSDQKFVRVLHPGAHFDDSELERFEKRKIFQLWVDANQFEMFYHDYKKDVLSSLAWTTLSSKERTQSLAMDHAMIHSAGKNFGWSADIIDHANTTIQNVMNFIEHNPDLKSILDEKTKTNASRISNHSVLLSIFCTTILKELGWQSKLASEKLTFAALLHDITLNEEIYTTMLTLLLNESSKEFEKNSNPEFKIILDHPLVVSEMLAHWQLCPPDVDVIIRQHHERPDGNGFPLGLKSLQISPLAAVLILAEDVLFHWNETPNANPKAYLETRKDFYNCGEFKNIYAAAIKSLSH